MPPMLKDEYDSLKLGTEASSIYGNSSSPFWRHNVPVKITVGKAFRLVVSPSDTFPNGIYKGCVLAIYRVSKSLTSTYLLCAKCFQSWFFTIHSLGLYPTAIFLPNSMTARPKMQGWISFKQILLGLNCDEII